MRSPALVSLTLLVLAACADLPPGSNGDSKSGKPDLKIKSASMAARRIVIGHELPMLIEVKNKNSATASVIKRFHISAVARLPRSEGLDPIVEQVRFDSPTLGDSDPKTYFKIDTNLKPKQVAQVQTVGYLSIFPNGTELEIIVTVDPKQRIDELDETNNTNQRWDPNTSQIIEASRVLVTLP